MAEENPSQDEKTEEASQERRDEFRKRGDVAVSREITSVFVLVSAIVFLSFYAPVFLSRTQITLQHQFERIATFRINKDNALEYANDVWLDVLTTVMPLFVVAAIIATVVTLGQTRFNWSWQKMKPNFQKFNILKGLANMVSMRALVELLKGIGKLSAVGVVSYLILRSEWTVVPGLMLLPIRSTWAYWGDITQILFWSVSGLLLLIAGLDYIYNFISLERKMKMTKQEVKEEAKRREQDPHLKGRMRRMQREIAMRQAVEKTKEATVLITNPTHFSIAIKYEFGMAAPEVIAKGQDLVALRMREVAKEMDIPIVENKPLARTLYKIVEVGQQIPASLYKAVSEVIRYVFRLKGIRLPNTSSRGQTQNRGAR